MITFVDDRAHDNLLQLTQIHDVTRVGVGRTAQRHLEYIIMAVPVGIGAQPVMFLIPRLTLSGIMQPMRRIKMNLPRNINVPRPPAGGSSG